MNKNILNLSKVIQPYKDMVVNHDLYNKLNSADDISVLMSYHVYAVWDFMSLLKSLQNHLTCTSSPWKPVGDSETRRLINSIVLEEESDVDANGNPSSHFEMYLDAMNECGADTKEINNFLNNVNKSYIPTVNIGVDDFLKTTFNIINSNKPHIIASAFTFGREDLIPDMFSEIVNQYNNDNKLDKFVYYLERHIELDGGDHGPLALQLISNLCENDTIKWKEVEESAIESLIARKNLWDFVSKQLN